ncbi:glycoside hydrolase family 65 protein [Micromonospora sp. PPF5-17]|uniref:Glycoside hydrolase family 65 protein n=2 Tax=Micromonosporaceae TaxID=28056 RepID=A0ABX9WI13_9ACTN|nr:glycoside hydrolase family 65 protein [Micromonospora sp. PPF5-17B]NES36266.1 glycoside hydrolase family 65 protein [Micromonospora solifontis]NES55094.1 glycoside hydrolase family 65 protein [Micromonospora sp. PPF5-6]RNL99736.1 glycoside hydrolase family 65 protein [Micromonospora solifontis]
MLTLGNGYLATRGAAPEASADGVHYPGTYLAGFHNRLPGGAGRPDGEESIVNLPNWLPLTFRPAGGDWYAPGRARRVHEHRMLDLRRGVQLRELVVVDPDRRRTRLRQRRLVSMANPHFAALETSIVAENWSGRLELRSGIDGGVSNAETAARVGAGGRHLADVTGGANDDAIWLTAVAAGSRQPVAVTARTTVGVVDAAAPATRTVVRDAAAVAEMYAIDVLAGTPITIDKTVAVFCGRDRAVHDPLTAAAEALRWAGTFAVLLADHVAAWDRLWSRFRLDVGEEHVWQLPLRVQTFHLLQTLSPHTVDLDAGVPARGLHGEGYHGHVFWDELFVYPYLNLRLPELTRALLEYRYRRLPAARRQAAAAGMAGALFPWQSATSGRDESPVRSPSPVTGEWQDDRTGRQHHVNLAVSYSVWRYWETTGDLSFLLDHGAELLIATARFWAGLATYDPSDDRYDIRGVLGPDEYHDGYPGRAGQGLDNCAYINVMVAWVLARADEACVLQDRHPGAAPWRAAAVPAGERRRWTHIARRLRLVFLPNGLLAQFAGYGDLVELDWDRYRRRYGDLRLLGPLLQAEGDDPNRYKISKQADVLMLLYLFSAEELTALIRGMGYHFDPARIPATVDHYLSRTTHGSTLSRIAHAWVLARTDRRRSFHMLLDALGTDLADPAHSSTREGIHLGATAGTLDILQRCYTGLEVRGDVLRLNPVLPEGMDQLDCVLRYRNRLLVLHVDCDQVRISAGPGADPPVPVAVQEQVHLLAAGAIVTVPLRRRDPGADRA